MTNDEISMIIALTLGDGHITPEGRYCVNHCESQKEYIEYKKQILDKIIGGKPITIHKTKNVVKGKEYHGYTIRKCNKKKLQPIRELLYTQDGHKKFTRDILDKLTLEGIAIWYMDDGSLSAEKDSNGKIHSYKLGIATYISKEENEVIQQYFDEMWGIHWNIHKDGDKYRIRMGTQEARKFIQLIKPYVIPSMSYKVLDI